MLLCEPLGRGDDPPPTLSPITVPHCGTCAKCESSAAALPHQRGDPPDHLVEREARRIERQRIRGGGER